jgi:hypothetical protein
LEDIPDYLQFELRTPPIISASNESAATSIICPRNWLNIAIVKKMWEENGKREFVFAFKDEKTS